MDEITNLKGTICLGKEDSTHIRLPSGDALADAGGVQFHRMSLRKEAMTAITL